MSLAPAADGVLRILLLLARQAEPVPAASIAAALGLPRSTTYRLLGVLVDQGLVGYLPEERRFGLGVVAFELGSAYSRQMALRRIGQPVLSRLVRAVRQNAHLAVLHGPDVYYVIEERARGRPALVTDVGVRLPATLTASGQAILAALPAAQVRAIFPAAATLVQRGGRGPATLGELRRVLAATRARGYALEEGLVTDGLSSVGVPVRDHTGHPAAGLSVTFATDQVPPPQRPALIEAVRRSAAGLSRRLGG